MPRMGEPMVSGEIRQLWVEEGSPLRVGSTLLDVRVDLSARAVQDCPPIYYFRVVSNEKGWVRKLSAAVGDTREVGQVLALISTELDEPLEGEPVRALRVSRAG